MSFLQCGLRFGKGIFSGGVASQHSKWLFHRALCSAALPDHKMIYMPKLSPTMEVGTIQSWTKKEGDPISSGDIIAEIETDKAARSFEFNDDAFLAKIIKEEGAADIPVGDPIGITVENEEDISAFKDYVVSSKSDAATSPAASPPSVADPASEPSSPVTPAPSIAVTSAPSPSVAAGAGGRIIASPFARHAAAQSGISLQGIAGTGPGGRVIAADVSDALSRAPVAAVAAGADMTVQGMPLYTDLEVTKYRKVTAERLVQSKQTVPHYYLSIDCIVDEMLELRKKLNARSDEYKLSVNDFVIKAAATALRKVPEVNSQWNNGTSIRRFHAADISVAVQTDLGLITPIVKDADRKGLKEISQDVKSLAAKAKENTLAPEEFMGGTFTISNLGMFGIESFSAIVNPPQAAILAVGASVKKIVPDDTADTGMAAKTVMNVTLSCDHRVVDGAVGAQWLREFKRCIEDPVEIIM